MRFALISVATVLCVLACGPVEQESSAKKIAELPPITYSSQEKYIESSRLNVWFEKKYEQEVLLSPITLSYLGRSERQGEIDDYSNQAASNRIALKKANLAELKSRFNYDKLTDDAKISYDLWVYLSETAIAEYEFRDNRYIFEQMTAVHNLFPQLLVSLHKAENGMQMQQYLDRILAIAVAIDQLIVVSKDIAEKGVRPPYFAFDMVIAESTKIISGQPFGRGEDSVIWADAKSKIDGLVANKKIYPETADVLKSKIKKALVGDFQAAYKRLIQWQKEDKKKALSQALGASALPNGKAYYNERLANQTTTKLNADEIHKIGLQEVERLRGEMQVMMRVYGFKGNLDEFFVFLRENKDNRDLYYPNTDEGRQAYIDDATAAIEEVKEQLPEYFNLMPKADMVVKRVESFREQDGAAQHYSPSTPDGSRPGVYYVHLSDMTAMPKRELEVIAYHEGLPGHHMQLAISLELENIPTFRKQSYLNAYGEGWALYAEWLAKDMPSTYLDALSEFGRLGSEMWRAIRLVVDTGLHAKDWSEQQAIDYFKQNSAITSEQALSEVRRYLTIPGQATGYKIGMMKIQELRALSESELGEAFDIREFHDVILGGGGLPMTILQRKVETWIEKKKIEQAEYDAKRRY